MLLEVKNLSKTFSGVVALSNVTVGFLKGEIHALVGENGAGKSTLIKIIGGKYHSDSGRILFKGQELKITDPHKALEMGISIVYQEYNLIPNLKVVENILLGHEPTGKLRKIDWRIAEEFSLDLMKQMHVSIDLNRYVGELGAAEAKIVEILKALAANAEIVIMDEPTAALPEREVEALFGLIRSLKDSGVIVIFISHRINEIFSIADRVTVLKDGKLIGTHAVNKINHDRLIRSMVGRELRDVYPSAKKARTEKAVLSVREINDGKRLKDVTFNLNQGEILGIGGMTGNGQRELIRILFGAHQPVKGRIFFNNNEVAINSPETALKLGIGFIPDDRRNEGVAVTQSVRKNISLPSLHLRQIAGVILGRKEKEEVEKTINALNIKVTSIAQKVQNLSGGNQQRVVISKWLPLKPKILLFHEPTLGIDVGAKVEIYKLMRSFTEQGVSIIMVSSDMIELLNVPDRILVFYDGSISAEFTREEATEEAVIFAASGN